MKAVLIELIETFPLTAPELAILGGLTFAIASTLALKPQTPCRIVMIVLGITAAVFGAIFEFGLPLAEYLQHNPPTV